MSRAWRFAAAAVAAVCAVALLLAPWAGTALVVSAPGPAPDVIVSLASHEWERLPAVAAQAKTYPAALVVLTVPQEVTIHNCHDCANRPARLIRAGVAKSRIREMQLKAGGTYGEALALKDFMREHGLRRLMVVTSPYHTRRSRATFETVLAGTGVTVGIVPALASSPARPGSWIWSGYDRAYVQYEWAAIVYYWMRYHVPLTA